MTNKRIEAAISAWFELPISPNGTASDPDFRRRMKAALSAAQAADAAEARETIKALNNWLTKPQLREQIKSRVLAETIKREVIPLIVRLAGIKEDGNG